MDLLQTVCLWCMDATFKVSFTFHKTYFSLSGVNILMWVLFDCFSVTIMVAHKVTWKSLL